jgi:bacterioferritin-associated ferredoxin
MSTACTTDECNACSLRVVCRCLRLTETTVVEAITNLGLRTLKEVRRHTGAGDGCTCCHDELEGLLEQHG